MFDFGKILSFIFPNRCPFCYKVISYEEFVCDSCNEKMRYNNFKDLVMTPGGKTFVSISPFYYKEPIRTAIHRFKFRDEKKYAKPFAGYITKVLLENYKVSEIDCITSIPLHRERQKDRGFNQSEVFAREISKLTGINYIETLKKVKKDKVQHELSLSERAENVKGVYEIIDEAEIKGKVFLLCDDILTSGNTMAACAEVLFKAGAKAVIGATIANVEGDNRKTARLTKKDGKFSKISNLSRN